MDLSLVISIISLIIALFVASYSIYNIERDNAKIEAWAEVNRYTPAIYRDKNEEIKILVVTVANVGRRPIIIKGIKVQAKGINFDIPAKQPYEDITYTIDSKTDVEAFNEEVRNRLSTRNTCVVLKEGEFFEKELVVDGRTNDLIAFIDDDWHKGENIYVQDIIGRLYLVGNFKRELDRFNEET